MTSQGTIGVCILSWRSGQVLARTLATYLKHDLFSLVDDYCVLFQEVSQEDIDIANQYNLNYIVTNENLGIYGGVKKLAEHLNTDYVLLLEDDCILIEPKEVLAKRLELARKRLDDGHVDVYRLRHRWQPGEKFDTVDKFKKIHPVPNETHSVVKWFKRLVRPAKYKRLIGTSVYVQEYPQGYLYDKYITPTAEGDFIVSSAVMNWTNQSVLCKRKWLLDTILNYVDRHPCKRTVNGKQDIEKSLNCKWWRDKDFKIGVGEGVFSHKRLTA